MIAALLGPVANLGGTCLEGQVATKKAKIEANIVKIKPEATISAKNPNSALRLNRKRWKCSGSKSRRA